MSYKVYLSPLAKKISLEVSQFTICNMCRDTASLTWIINPFLSNEGPLSKVSEKNPVNSKFYLTVIPQFLMILQEVDANNTNTW